MSEMYAGEVGTRHHDPPPFPTVEASPELQQMNKQYANARLGRAGQGPQAHGFNYQRRMMSSGTELRVRRDEKGQLVVGGHAIVFDSESVPLGWGDEFIEKISPDVKIEYADGDVFSLFNHDWSQVLGRLSAGTMTVRRCDIGLYVETFLADNERNRMLAQSIERGDIRGQSFGFELVDEEWEKQGDSIYATVSHILLHEVTITPIPAYPATDIEVMEARSRLTSYQDRLNRMYEKEKGRRELQRAKLRMQLI